MALNPLEQINLITIAGLMLIFTATYLILRKILFLPLIQIMERRDLKISGGKETIARAEFLICDAQNKADSILAEARQEAEHIIETGSEDNARLREEKVKQASDEADRLLSKELEKMSLLRKSEQKRLEESLLFCVSKTLKKSIGYSNEKVIQSMVAKVLASRSDGERTQDG